jgi:hypothetical protein
LTLVLEVLRSRAYPLVKLVRSHNVGDQIRRLKFVYREIHRLFQHPELFPSPVVRALFVALLASDATLQFTQAVKGLLLREITEDFALRSHMYTRPTYLPGSKGWENYLLNNAPGLPLKHLRVTTIPKTSYQVIPITGLRIIGDATREERHLANWINSTPVPADAEPAETTKLLDLDKPDAQQPYPDIPLSQQSYDVFLQPNPIRERTRTRFDLSTHGRDSLEDYSPFVGRLESPPIAPNHPIGMLNAPNIFPVISLRSWHPPTKLGAIRYIRNPTQSSTGQQGAPQI